MSEEVEHHIGGFAALSAANSRDIHARTPEKKKQVVDDTIARQVAQPVVTAMPSDARHGAGKSAAAANPLSQDPSDWIDMSSRQLGAEISDIPGDSLRPILQQVREHHPQADLTILRKAYNRAVWQHRLERRRSGEPYIIHPLGVAQILADLGMTPRVVAAGLLHDTVEDT
ncbi:MAG: HD domain-containing protein, partial [Aeriscardovia aeriphila]|nr:HD domain-containing protein [Aeriscardovia aeriphila]